MVTSSTVSKWGNGQGIRIPKIVCDTVGVEIGDPFEMRVTNENTLVISFPKKAYRRNKKVTIDELFTNKKGNWDSEEFWGKDVGLEVVE